MEGGDDHPVDNSIEHSEKRKREKALGNRVHKGENDDKTNEGGRKKGKDFIVYDFFCLIRPVRCRKRLKSKNVDNNGNTENVLYDSLPITSEDNDQNQTACSKTCNQPIFHDHVSQMKFIECPEQRCFWEFVTKHSSSKDQFFLPYDSRYHRIQIPVLHDDLKGITFTHDYTDDVLSNCKHNGSLHFMFPFVASFVTSMSNMRHQINSWEHLFLSIQDNCFFKNIARYRFSSKGLTTDGCIDKMNNNEKEENKIKINGVYDHSNPVYESVFKDYEMDSFSLLKYIRCAPYAKVIAKKAKQETRYPTSKVSKGILTLYVVNDAMVKYSEGKRHFYERKDYAEKLWENLFYIYNGYIERDYETNRYAWRMMCLYAIYYSQFLPTSSMSFSRERGIYSITSDAEALISVISRPYPAYHEKMKNRLGIIPNYDKPSHIQAWHDLILSCALCRLAHLYDEGSFFALLPKELIDCHIQQLLLQSMVTSTTMNDVRFF